MNESYNVDEKQLNKFKDIEDLVQPIAEKYKVKAIYLFGSYARGEADENSDFYNAIMKERRLIA
ncbi:MAG: nucleotidyltransferase domain-containing protein [Blautia sp.]|nr:nucleotidyltransferase domain-containing protein [Blautia sp.]